MISDLTIIIIIKMTSQVETHKNPRFDSEEKDGTANYSGSATKKISLTGSGKKKISIVDRIVKTNPTAYDKGNEDESEFIIKYSKLRQD